MNDRYLYVETCLADKANLHYNYIRLQAPVMINNLNSNIDSWRSSILISSWLLKSCWVSSSPQKVMCSHVLKMPQDGENVIQKMDESVDVAPITISTCAVHNICYTQNIAIASQSNTKSTGHLA